MSKANGTSEKKDTYLQHVSLKNYKSIKDVEIDFKPGLNIIIGKNASGKTNFINGLDAILNFSVKELFDVKFAITTWSKNQKIQIQALISDQMRDDLLAGDYYSPAINRSILLKINNDDIEVPDYQTKRSYLQEKGLLSDWVLINYGSHYKKTSPFINLPFSFILINNRKVSSDLMKVTMDDNDTEFINSFFQILSSKISLFYRLENRNKGVKKNLKSVIISSSEDLLKNINDFIIKYSPIQAMRLNPDFNLINENDGERQTITNFYLEFLIDKNWLPFGLLSDGTKRLFYIISEILATYDHSNNILLEEPELGIHPHQLHLLMLFIKEQSRDKQIIITTHSPQVLDTIGSDELDRIIICEYDGKNGTQLRHLTEKETDKAKIYMEDAFLSDYWRFSDLEPVS